MGPGQSRSPVRNQLPRAELWNKYVGGGTGRKGSCGAGGRLRRVCARQVRVCPASVLCAFVLFGTLDSALFPLDAEEPIYAASGKQKRFPRAAAFGGLPLERRPACAQKPGRSLLTWAVCSSWQGWVTKAPGRWSDRKGPSRCFCCCCACPTGALQRFTEDSPLKVLSPVPPLQDLGGKWGLNCSLLCS